MIKRTKYNIILILLICLLIFLVITILYFFIIYNNYTRDNKSIAYTETIIKPNTILEFNTNYSSCNHTIKNSIYTNDYINYSLDELQEKYPDWTFQSYENNTIKFYKKVNDFCNEHYLVKINNNNIYIYQLDINNNIENVINSNISIDYLTDDDKNNLYDNVYIYR